MEPGQKMRVYLAVRSHSARCTGEANICIQLTMAFPLRYRKLYLQERFCSVTVTVTVRLRWGLIPLGMSSFDPERRVTTVNGPGQEVWCHLNMFTGQNGC